MSLAVQRNLSYSLQRLLKFNHKLDLKTALVEMNKQHNWLKLKWLPPTESLIWILKLFSAENI